jgi:outer membrane protein assembly factor BamB
VNGKGQIIFGAGDGFVYGFDPAPLESADDIKALKEIWRYDCNPPEYKKAQYPDADGPSEVIATAVLWKNRVYVATGQDPEHGDGVGILHCIDATQTGDVTQEGKVWSYKDIGRSISTVSITEDGLLFVAEYAGKIHCLDAETGSRMDHDTQAHIWASTLVLWQGLYQHRRRQFLRFRGGNKRSCSAKLISVSRSGDACGSQRALRQTPTRLYAIANE